jgi:hypothetical protein
VTHDEYETLERAIIRGTRIAVIRRGAEYIVIPRSLRHSNGREAIEARNPTTGDDMIIFIDEVDAIEVVR